MIEHLHKHQEHSNQHNQFPMQSDRPQNVFHLFHKPMANHRHPDWGKWIQFQNIYLSALGLNWIWSFTYCASIFTRFAAGTNKTSRIENEWSTQPSCGQFGLTFGWRQNWNVNFFLNGLINTIEIIFTPAADPTSIDSKK